MNVCRRLFAPPALGLLCLLAAACAEAGDEGGGAETAASTRAPLVGADDPDVIAGQYIVVFKDQSPEPARNAALARLGKGGRVARTFGVIPGFVASLEPADLDALRDDPNVAFVEADKTVRADTTFASPADGLDRVDQREGNNGLYNDFNCNGSGIDVYVIDSGMRTAHNEFAGRVGNGGFSINDGRGVEDCNGHGTHVASIAAGTQFGMAKKAVLHPVRVLDCAGSGPLSGIINGVDFVRNDCTGKGRKCVANMSLGAAASQALDNAVTAAINAGITFAVSAGNNNTDACNQSPARAAAAITVAASDDDDARASFSNFGTCVDLFAPGVSILGADDLANNAVQNLSGTSQASPHVAGAVAQFLSCNPNATPAQARSALLNNATRNCISGVNGSPNVLLHNNFNAGTFSCN